MNNNIGENLKKLGIKIKIIGFICLGLYTIYSYNSIYLYNDYSNIYNRIISPENQLLFRVVISGIIIYVLSIILYKFGESIVNIKIIIKEMNKEYLNEFNNSSNIKKYAKRGRTIGYMLVAVYPVYSLFLLHIFDQSIFQSGLAIILYTTILLIPMICALCVINIVTLFLYGLGELTDDIKQIKNKTEE